MPAEAGLEFFTVDGLRQVINHTGIQTFLLGPVHRVRRQGYDGMRAASVSRWRISRAAS
jgi:hypothetical protein